MSSAVKTYSQLLELKTLEERLEYLRCLSVIKHELPRKHINWFYRSQEWLNARQAVIARDLGFDCGTPGVNISGRYVIHHINQLTDYDIQYRTDKCFDLENLICVSEDSHLYIHYGTKKEDYIERKPGDTTLW